MTSKKTVIVHKKARSGPVVESSKDLSPAKLAIAARRQEEILMSEQRRIAAGGKPPTVLEFDEWE